MCRRLHSKMLPPGTMPLYVKVALASIGGTSFSSMTSPAPGGFLLGGLPVASYNWHGLELPLKCISVRSLIIERTVYLARSALIKHFAKRIRVDHPTNFLYFGKGQTSFFSDKNISRVHTATVKENVCKRIFMVPTKPLM